MEMLYTGKTITIGQWVMKIRRPEGVGPFPVLLMFHGWTGNENSMWVFASHLLKNALLIAPRGFYSTSGRGYSWYPKLNKPLPWIDDLIPAAQTIYSTINSQSFPDGDFSNLHLVGFSQGAALAYTMTIMEPERVTSLAGLAGFLPDGASAWLQDRRLQGLPVFIAHGSLDERVPVERARSSVAQLEQAGASVTYCEDNVGHKLSAKCFRGLEAFYEGVKS
jgi:phospholipase/carboxylesterase